MSILPQLIINGIIAGSIYALIASGFSLIYSVVNFMHFAHGGVYVASAFVAYALFRILGMNFVASFILTMIVAAGLGVLIDQIAYKPLRKRGSSNLAFLISSIGLFIFLQSLVQLIFGAEIRTLRTGVIQKGYEFLGAVITSTQIWILIIALVLLILLHFFIKKSKLGKAMRAVADDKEVAQICGIRPERIIIYTFAIGSALAAAAGILIALEQNLEPNMGMTAMLKGITASIVGGIGSVPGAMLGSYLVGFAENFGIWFLPSGYKDAIAFVILVIFLLFRPRGLFGLWKRI